MRDPARMLVVGKLAEGRADLDRLVAACGVDPERLRVAPARALEAIGADEDWDVLLIHLDAAVGEMGAALRRREAWEGRVPIVLLANQLSAEVATLAHSYGARVCLIEHGADPLRLALMAAAEDAVAYREQRESAEASEQIAMVHSSISDVVFHLRVEDERFRFVEVNAAFLRATGLSEEQVVGKFVDEVIPEPSLSKVLGRYRRAISERRTVRWEEVTPYPAGTKYGEVSITPMFNAQGRCTRMIGTVQDVTEVRRRALVIQLHSGLLERVAAGDPLGSTLDALSGALAEALAPVAKAVRVVGAGGAVLAGRAEAGRSPWTTAITAPSGRALGAIEVYPETERSPAASELEVLAGFSHVAGIAIHRDELDEQLRELSARIDAAREEERIGIARELHDQLGQSLTVLKIDLSGIARGLRTGTGPGPEAVLERLGATIKMADESIDELRRISAELRPAMLDQLGLGPALTGHAEEFAARTQLQCVVDYRLDDRPIDRALALALFRVCQEALTNVARHAAANRVEVSVSESPTAIVLQVRDDGRGITPTEIENPRSFGLVGMRERARRLGGSVALQRGEPRGTVLILTVPVAGAAA